MSIDNWEELYVQAAMEVDGRRVPQRVAAVRTAIRKRLQRLENSSSHHAERVRLAITLERLDTLEDGAEEW